MPKNAKVTLQKKIKNLRKNLNTSQRPFLKTSLVLLVLLIILTIAYLGKSVFVAAMVNGSPVFRLELIRQLEKQQGTQTLDNLITKKLIFQEAKKQGVTTSQQEVQDEISRIRGLVEAQGSTIEEVLSTQGQTMTDLEENIKIQKTIEKILQDKIQVSDDEIKKYFDENKNTFAKDAKLEDVKEQIKGTLTQQKLSQEFTTWIRDLRNSSNIIYFVNF